MSKITLRHIAKVPESGRILKGQKTYLLSRSPLRCYYYNKQVRGRWSTADRAIYGMRWNAYLASGKVTPKFENIHSERLPGIVKGLMKEIEAKKLASISVLNAFSGKTERVSMPGAGRGRENETCRVSGEQPEPVDRVIPISRHVKFRHLHIVRTQVQEEPQVSNVRIIKDRAARPEQAVDSPQHKVGPLKSGKREVKLEIAQIVPAEEHTVMAAAQPGILSYIKERGERRGEMGIFHRQEHKAPKMPVWHNCEEPQMQIFKIALGILPGTPENDNALPHGPEPIAQAAMAARSIKVGAKVGYISSSRRAVIRLKTAQGAADLPQ
jgi:hypothetical protein